jgi:6,7-dimethyl-8-ribityllumazine synthase
LKQVRAPRSGKGLRVGVVVSRFNEEVTKRLLDGALQALDEAKVSQRSITIVSVPGAFELPAAAQKLAKSKKVDAIVCLGAVIRGETDHFNYVSSAAQEGILRVTLDTGVPITFGVLTTDTVDQALARSGGDWGNKGHDATLDAIEMVNIYRELSR